MLSPNFMQNLRQFNDLLNEYEQGSPQTRNFSGSKEERADSDNTQAESEFQSLYLTYVSLEPYYKNLEFIESAQSQIYEKLEKCYCSLHKLFAQAQPKNSFSSTDEINVKDIRNILSVKCHLLKIYVSVKNIFQKKDVDESCNQINKLIDLVGKIELSSSLNGFLKLNSNLWLELSCLLAVLAGHKNFEEKNYLGCLYSLTSLKSHLKTWDEKDRTFKNFGFFRNFHLLYLNKVWIFLKDSIGTPNMSSPPASPIRSVDEKSFMRILEESKDQKVLSLFLLEKSTTAPLRSPDKRKELIRKTSVMDLGTLSSNSAGVDGIIESPGKVNGNLRIVFTSTGSQDIVDASLVEGAISGKSFPIFETENRCIVKGEKSGYYSHIFLLGRNLQLLVQTKETDSAGLLDKYDLLTQIWRCQHVLNFQEAIYKMNSITNQEIL